MLGKRKLVIKLDDKNIIIKGNCSGIDALMIAGALLSNACKKAPKERRKGRHMTNQNTKQKNLFTKEEMTDNFKFAFLQGIAMFLTTLEWHYELCGEQLTDLYENVKAIAEMPPIFGKNPSAAEQILHLKETYGIDLHEIKVQIEIVDERGKSKGVLKR